MEGWNNDSSDELDLDNLLGEIDFDPSELEKLIVMKNKKIRKTDIEPRAMKQVIKNDRIHYLKVRALVDMAPKPLENEQYRIITERQFNAYALILHLLESEIIEEMYLAIYRINQPTVRSIISLIESGHIRKATFIISSFFNQTKVPEKWAIMLREFSKGNENTKHIYTHNHAKVLCVRTQSGYYVFEGSGNMSDNARIEQYLYENNKRSYEFHRKWMVELCDGGGVVL